MPWAWDRSRKEWETVEQLKVLKEMGYQMFQGFYFDKPMKVPEFEARYL